MTIGLTGTTDAMPIAPPRLARRAVLMLGLLLAGCGGDSGGTPRQYAPLSYAYLPAIKLNVARVDIDDGWKPGGGRGHVEYLSPVTPLAALRRMAEDRLVPGGASGHAQFTVEDASIVERNGNYAGNLAVRLDLLGEDGSPQGSAEARVQAVRPVTDDDDADAVQNDLYLLTTSMMSSMNVELEFQINHALHDQVQSTTPEAPTSPVETQDLTAPTGR